ncbi:MAG: preprotein translocase subunit SecE [Anaerolineales bacterium]|nr:preprotein translocase subunit SecE [Anaerolineales bacterium]
MTVKSIKPREPNALQRWFRETVGELRRVSWPTRSEAIKLTRIVIIVMFIAGAILGSLDALFERMFIVLLGR